MQWCEMHGYVAVAQMSKREHLLALGGASESEYVPPDRVVSWESFLFQVLLEQVDRANVLHVENSRVAGLGLKIIHILLRGSVENATR